MAKLTHPSQKIIDTFEMLKSGKSVNFESMVQRLGVKPVTAMVFICALRSDFNADIDTERDGRKVISYRLKNADAVAPRMVLKTKATKTKAPKAPKVSVTKTSTSVSRKATKATNAASVEEYQVEEVSDAELADLKQQLGIG